MAARYVNPENIAAQGQSFYTGLHPVQYESGGGGGKNVMGAGSGGSAGVGADRSGADASRAWNYPVMPSASIRNKNKGQEDDKKKGPPKEEGGIPFGLPEPDLPPYGTPPGSPNGHGTPGTSIVPHPWARRSPKRVDATFTRTSGRRPLELGSGSAGELTEARGPLTTSDLRRHGQARLDRFKEENKKPLELGRWSASTRAGMDKKNARAQAGRDALKAQESGATVPVKELQNALSLGAPAMRNLNRP
jgi:hypothetical protein